MSDKNTQENQYKAEPADQELHNLLDQVVLSSETEEDRDGRTAQLKELMSQLDPDYRRPGTDTINWTPLNDYRRRKKIEARLEPMSYEKYIRSGYVEQVVNLSRSVTVKFRSLRPRELGFLEGWTATDILEEKPTIETAVEDLLGGSNSISILNELVLSIMEINGQPFKDGSVFVKSETNGRMYPDMSKCNARRAEFEEMGLDLAADLHIQLVWFKERVLDMYQAEAIEAF